jgi:hypothetical protein
VEIDPESLQRRSSYVLSQRRTILHDMASRRHPKRMHRTLSIDLLADWRPFADPLPASADPRAWQLYGTVTIDGTTGALAWKPGGYAIVTGSTLRELGMWERIDVANTVAIKKPPGHEAAPRSPVEPGWGSVYTRGMG